MSPQTARNINLTGLTVICIVLLGAYIFQFGKGELPCPLCLLQRCGMLGIALGLMLNIRFGSRPSHYAISILSAVFGGLVSVRQILLHIVPGTGAYGSPILGLHLYTWALVIFLVTVIVICIVMMFDSQFKISPQETYQLQKACPPQEACLPLAGYAKFIFFALIIIALANTVTTFLECGFMPCDDNPVKYKML